ncbi:MAG: UDP-N-acetylmuramoyl-tripeptide--D-alanyl-D-alanine ligase [Patescibacteria group bacterium]
MNWFVLIIQAFILFWLARAFKTALFWVYLWQLKEYHIGRFIDHFRTHKGKKIFLNFIFIAKVILLILVFLPKISGLLYYIFGALFLIYGIEFFIFLKSILAKNLKIPKFTSKTIFLTSSSFIVVVFYAFWAADYLKTANWRGFFYSLLLFDVISPIIITGLVLIFQPVFILFRDRMLSKAKAKIKKFDNLTVIAITGSYGKTTTKEFLKTILSEKFNVLATPEHKNSEAGIAETILNDLNESHRIFIVEMGAYQKGGISLLCDIVKPKIGIVTGVNEQHLATFGSMENLLSAEGGRELAENLTDGGTIILNGDNKHCLDLYKKFSGNKKLYSAAGDRVEADIKTEHISVEKEFIHFIAKDSQKYMADFKVAVLGRHNISNLLAAILAAKELGMSLEEIAIACKKIKQEQGGIVLKKGIHGINIIDSSYSSNPDGVLADLDYLDIFEGKKVIVMPCLIELGEKSSEIHQKIGQKIAEVCDLAIITTKDKFEEIKQAATLHFHWMPENQIILSQKPKEILMKITTFCKEGDAVLLEGRVMVEIIKLLK